MPKKRGIKVPDFSTAKLRLKKKSKTKKKKTTSKKRPKKNTKAKKTDKRPTKINHPKKSSSPLSKIKKEIIKPKKALSPMARIKQAILKRLRIGEAEEMIKSDIKRIKTGIPGLDKELQGGFIKNSAVLISGSPGSGKSIFAMQFLYKGATEDDEPGVYISFEEEKEDVFKYMKEFGWDLKELEKKKKFVFLRYTPEQINKVLKEGGGIVDNVIRKIKAKRIVIDSITAFSLLHKNELVKRETLLDLFRMINKWQCTTVVTAEQEANPEKHRFSIEEFEVDGVILLYYQRKKNIRERVVEILKMRGTKIESKIFPMKITEEGMAFYPEETVF